jgi:hypothetical protein
MKTALELLANIQVASPCMADWNEMTGDDHARFCGQCEKHVYNLSALTADEAIRLIREKEGNICGRFYRRGDGTVLTADCPVGAHHKIRRKRRLTALAASLAGFLMMNSGCTRFDDESGTSTATPPAKQERAKPETELDNLKEGRCVMGKIDFRDIRKAGDSPVEPSEPIGPPREVESIDPAR